MAPKDLVDEMIIYDQILVFRTNLNSIRKARLACRELERIEGVLQVNVDLKDHENVLRVECKRNIQPAEIENSVLRIGFYCSELEG
ncbi:hypothetical protein C900_03092 [Fulvivirga imtechensis AK7]|uniref:HMA domain-containing protein n=1 Tax=Fulvivirga imtechensis AK7 TaxID=1237149 RepID=L8JSD8_9BACT|nr:hypothetical protein [Fulvivirga imtechensis]ELR71128.1 hypothetical protein C900_03092 [Fulvivirga imtechensis AK7]